MDLNAKMFCNFIERLKCNKNKFNLNPLRATCILPFRVKFVINKLKTTAVWYTFIHERPF